jgi:hypothetical protein
MMTTRILVTCTTTAGSTTTGLFLMVVPYDGSWQDKNTRNHAPCSSSSFTQIGRLKKTAPFQQPQQQQQQQQQQEQQQKHYHQHHTCISTTTAPFDPTTPSRRRRRRMETNSFCTGRRSVLFQQSTKLAVSSLFVFPTGVANNSVVTIKEDTRIV